MANNKAAVRAKSRKPKHNIGEAIAHITASFNNTLITVSDIKGAVVAASSAGAKGFKGSRKGTPFAAQTAAEHVAGVIKEMGVKTLIVRVQGPGPGRESAIRGLRNEHLDIISIIDVTPIPHNGCRPPKRRRV